MNTQKRTGLLKAGLASAAVAITVAAMPTCLIIRNFNEVLIKS